MYFHILSTPECLHIWWLLQLSSVQTPKCRSFILSGWERISQEYGLWSSPINLGWSTIISQPFFFYLHTCQHIHVYIYIGKYNHIYIYINIYREKERHVYTSSSIFLSQQVMSWAPAMGSYFAVFSALLELIGIWPLLRYSPNHQDAQSSARVLSA